MTTNSISVFISYSHDSSDHDEQILAFANRLREEGIDAQIDQYEPGPPEGWTRWMTRQIEKADFVLVVCTENYRQRVEGKGQVGRGLGGNREGLLIDQNVYESGGVNKKFIAVTLVNSDRDHIPTFLRPYQSESIATESEYETLYRRLTHQPQIVKPELGARRALPPRGRKAPAETSILDQPRYDFHIFLCYAQADHQAFADQPSWVIQFRNDLQIRLAMVFGREPRIWMNSKSIKPTLPFDDEIKEAIKSSALLLPILSPAFFASDVPQREVEYFIEFAGIKRVVQVYKYPTDSPSFSPGTVAHNFYRRTVEGMPQELSGDRYLKALDILVSDISNRLNLLM